MQQLSMAGVGPIADGIGLMHPVTSCCGERASAVTSDRAMVPDPEPYAECIQQSFDDPARTTG